jgi:hypothetical protein
MRIKIPTEVSIKVKKWASLFGAFVLGVVVASSTGTVAAKVNSLIGKKVTAELTVVVNGKELADKGAVVDGRTNAPVRAIAEAVGGNVTLSGNTVTINTEQKAVPSESKAELTAKKDKIETSIKSTIEEIEITKTKMENAKIPGTDRYEGEETYKAAIEILESSLSNKQAELDKINEALKNNE